MGWKRRRLFFKRGKSKSPPNYNFRMNLPSLKNIHTHTQTKLKQKKTPPEKQINKIGGKRLLQLPKISHLQSLKCSYISMILFPTSIKSNWVWFLLDLSQNHPRQCLAVLQFGCCASIWLIDVGRYWTWDIVTKPYS